MKRTLFLLSILVLFGSVFAQDLSEEEAMNAVKECIRNVEDCDCSQFAHNNPEYDHEEDCERLTSIGRKCMKDLTAPECDQIDLEMLDAYGMQGREIRQWIEGEVRGYIPEIEECVNLDEECDCSQFPDGIDEFCNNYASKQYACLEEYDLEACNTLEDQDIEVMSSWTPGWVRAILEPLIRPLVELRQDAMRAQAAGSAMSSVGECFRDPYNCDCSSIKYMSIRADCEQRARLMRTCLEYRDCAMSSEEPANCTGREQCTTLVNMPVLPEATPGFMKPLIKPVVFDNVCPMMEDWPYDYGNYAPCLE